MDKNLTSGMPVSYCLYVDTTFKVPVFYIRSNSTSTGEILPVTKLIYAVYVS